MIHFIPLLQFVFQGFWTWLGFAVLLLIVFAGIAEILKAIRGKGVGTINLGLNAALSDLRKALTPSGAPNPPNDMGPK